MEAAIRSLLQNTFGEYVSGLDNVDVSKFPLTLRDLKLREKKIQEDMEEEGNFPFDITDGRIGSISVSPGWMGTVEICATNIVLNFSFSARKAMKRAMQPEQQDEEEFEEQHLDPRQMMAPPPMPPQQVTVPPRYCSAHSTSEQRVKVEPRFMQCTTCHTQLQTNYADFSLCPPCSEKQQRCMICGGSAPCSGSYVPAATLQQEPVQAGMGPPLPEPPRTDRQRPPLPRHLQGIGDDVPFGRERPPRGSVQAPPPQGPRPTYGDSTDLPPPPPPPRRDVSARDGTYGSQGRPGAWGSGRQPDDLPPPPPQQDGRRSARPSGIGPLSPRMREEQAYRDLPPGASNSWAPPPQLPQGGPMSTSNSWAPPMQSGPPQGGPMSTSNSWAPPMQSGPPQGQLPQQNSWQSRGAPSASGGPPGRGGSGPNGSMKDPYSSQVPQQAPSNLTRGEDGGLMDLLRNMDISKWVSCMTAGSAIGEGAQEFPGPMGRQPPNQGPPEAAFASAQERGPRQQRGGA